MGGRWRRAAIRARNRETKFNNDQQFLKTRNIMGPSQNKLKVCGIEYNYCRQHIV